MDLNKTNTLLDASILFCLLQQKDEYFVWSVTTEKRQNMFATKVIVNSEEIVTFLNDLFDDLTGKSFIAFF